MQKLPKLEYGRYYHIYNRGINRENIFIEERNYRHFLKLYVKRIEPVVDTFAYCLLKNHFHVLVRIMTESEQKQYWEKNQTSQDSEPWEVLDPTQQYSNFFNSYAKSINKAYDRTGSLFQKRFGRIEVTSDDYFIHLINYIHQNPQKHRFTDDFRTYPYSSYRAFLSSQPSRIKRRQVLDWFDGLDIFNRQHQTEPDEQQIWHLVEDDFV